MIEERRLAPRTPPEERQKIPIRSMIIAPPKKLLVSFDLAQAESWLVAYLAKEPTIKHALKFGDLHTETAKEALFKLSDEAWEELPKDERKSARYIGKRYNHATAYRMGPARACEVINKDSDKPPFVTVTHAESKKFYEAWHDHYNIKNWWDEIEYQLGQTHTLRTPYGRIRYFFAQWGNELFKEATAFVPQSTVADHLDGAVQDELGIEGGFIKVDELFVLPGHITIINQSHDSILFEVLKDDAQDILPQIHKLLLRPLVVNEEEFTIPVDCEVGERWGSGEMVECPRATGSTEIDFSAAA